MADNLTKLVTTITVNKEKVAASISKLNVAITNLANQNERITAKPEHTMPPKHYPHIISTTNPSTDIPSTQYQSAELPLQCLATTDIQAYCHQEPCFHSTKTFLVGHECPPPKFVFLEAEHEPPWKPFTVDYGNLGLEDKAVFQDGGIDTSPVTSPVASLKVYCI